MADTVSPRDETDLRILRALAISAPHRARSGAHRRARKSEPPRSQGTMSALAVYPCFPATLRGQPTSIKMDPKGEKLIYTLGRLVVVREAKPQPGRPPATL
eukprot:2795411-Pleurochrysis_carterae.AAC.1